MGKSYQGAQKSEELGKLGVEASVFNPQGMPLVTLYMNNYMQRQLLQLQQFNDIFLFYGYDINSSHALTGSFWNPEEEEKKNHIL